VWGGLAGGGGPPLDDFEGTGFQGHSLNGDALPVTLRTGDLFTADQCGDLSWNGKSIGGCGRCGPTQMNAVANTLSRKITNDLRKVQGGRFGLAGARAAAQEGS